MKKAENKNFWRLIFNDWNFSSKRGSRLTIEIYSWDLTDCFIIKKFLRIQVIFNLTIQKKIYLKFPTQWNWKWNQSKFFLICEHKCFIYDFRNFFTLIVTTCKTVSPYFSSFKNSFGFRNLQIHQILNHNKAEKIT